METAIVSIICITLILFGVMTMSQGFLTSADTTSTAMEELGKNGEEIMRTELAITSASMTDGEYLEVSLTNGGQTKLASFANWDVIVHYYDTGGTYYVKWLPYTEGALGDNQWKKTGIYLDGQAEVFGLDIVNPGEEIVIEAQLNPSVGDNTTNLAVISTPNGVPASISFSGPAG